MQDDDWEKRIWELKDEAKIGFAEKHPVFTSVLVIFGVFLVIGVTVFALHKFGVIGGLW